jgi:hypothetical protein
MRRPWKKSKVMLTAVERQRLQGWRKLDSRAESRLIARACSTPPGGRERWVLTPLAECLPPAADAEFVAAMRDVLAVYHRPSDAKRPLLVHARIRQVAAERAADGLRGLFLDHFLDGWRKRRQDRGAVEDHLHDLLALDRQLQGVSPGQEGGHGRGQAVHAVAQTAGRAHEGRQTTGKSVEAGQRLR